MLLARLVGISIIIFATFLGATSAYADSLDPAPPRGGDPFAGILDRGKLVDTKATRIDNIRDKRIAVILSDNTEKHLKWSEMAAKGWSESESSRLRAMHGQEYMDRYTRLHKEAYAPEVIVGGVVQPLVKKAKSVDVIQDMAEFVNGKFDLLVVLDVTFVNTIKMGAYYFGYTYQAGSYISAYFVGRSSTLSGVVEAGETRDVRRPPLFLDDAVVVRRDVIARYQSDIDKLLGPDKPAEIAPAATIVAPATRKNIAERLQELDSLVKQGLVKSDEADAMRKKILEDI